MENFKDLVQKRRSIRKFTDEEIKAEDLQMISYGFWLSMLMQSYGDFSWWRWTIRYENRINLAFQCHLSDVLPIYLGSCPRHSLEKADEIGNVAESQLVCYLLDAEFFGE